MEFEQDDYLQISGLQHFAFCRRQWALIHVENQWAENGRTADGAIFHARAHDAGARERRGEVLIVRDLRVFSPTLGITGACDVVEFHRASDGVTLHGEEGLYRPFPIEYKRGAPRLDAANELQLCAQAMCLEEMLCCEISGGALYFGQTRRRTQVAFTAQLRQQVRTCLQEMHELYQRGHTPRVKPSKSCNACSLKELCLPKLMRPKPVQAYLRKQMEDAP